MSFFKDFLSILRKKELSLVESYQEAEGIHTFVFEKEKEYTWKAGQYALFSITHKAVKNATKPFSIASAPDEKVVRLTTRIGEAPSEFKKAMLELKPGMTIKASGPVGTFYPKDNRPMLLIAGGIGITPFRSIIKQWEAEGQGSGQTVRLLYMDGRKCYLFRDELDGIASRTSLSAAYLDTEDDLKREIDQFAAAHQDNGQYFVAGPKALVDATTAYLQKNNISKRNINKDAFFGY